MIDRDAVLKRPRRQTGRQTDRYTAVNACRQWFKEDRTTVSIENQTSGRAFRLTGLAFQIVYKDHFCGF